MDLAEFAVGHGQDAREDQDRDEEQVALLQARGHQRQQQAPRIRISEGWSQKLVMVLLRSVPILGGMPSTGRSCPQASSLLSAAILVVILAGHDAQVAKPFGERG